MQTEFSVETLKQGFALIKHIIADSQGLPITANPLFTQRETSSLPHTNNDIVDDDHKSSLYKRRGLMF